MNKLEYQNKIYINFSFILFSLDHFNKNKMIVSLVQSIVFFFSYIIPIVFGDLFYYFLFVLELKTQ